VGENDFELSIPPFLGLHLYLMWNYFDHIFHLSWTLQMWTEHLAPTEINLDCIEQVKLMDHGHQDEGHPPTEHPTLWVVKAGQLLH
jgi:hypothetical protein